jgi:IS5 family transposase
VPDAKTVWLYRDGLAQAGKVEELFRQFDHCPEGDCKAIC